MTSIIDCQVHAYARDSPERPWLGFLHGPAEVTGDDMVDAMDEVGVDGALLVSPFSMYRYDASYAQQVHLKHPDRFGLIKPFDPESDDCAEQVEAWSEQPGVVGARLMLANHDLDASHPGISSILNTSARTGLPVNVLCWGKLPLMHELATRHPNTRIIVDHLGLLQPFEPPPPSEPFRDLDQVLALAALDNVAIKISGAGTLSEEGFPFPDIWPPLARLFEAFGFDRCMWGTDWTRAVNLLTYREGVDAFRQTETLSDSERAALMGGTLARLYNWHPGA